MAKPASLTAARRIPDRRATDVLGTLARNLSVLLGAQLVTFILSFLLRAALGRYLGDIGYGKLTFALSIGSIFSTVAGLGMMPLVTKEAARARELTGHYLANGITLRLLIGVPAYAGFCLLVTMLKSDPETRLLTYLVGLSLVFNLVVTMFAAVFQAHETMAYVSAGLIAEKTVTTVASIVLLHLGYGVIAVGGVMIVASATNLSVSAWLLRRLGPLKWSINPAIIGSILTAGLPFFIWDVFTTIYYRIDATMLSLMTNDAVTGWYGVSTGLFETLGFLPALLKTVLFPSLSRLYVEDREKFRQTFRQGFVAFSLVAPPIAFGTLALARPIVGLIYSLDQFGNSAVDLRILALGFIPLFYNIFLATVVVAVDKQRFWSLAAIACAVVNPAVNLVAIPYFQATIGNGGVGASWATDLIEVLLLGVGLALVPRDLFSAYEWSFAGRTLLIGALMGALVFSQADLGLVRGIALGAVFYGCGCFALRVIRPGDIAQFIQFVRARRMATSSNQQ